MAADMSGDEPRRASVGKLVLQCDESLASGDNGLRPCVLKFGRGVGAVHRNGVSANQVKRGARAFAEFARDFWGAVHVYLSYESHGV